MERLTDKAWKNLDPWEMCGQDHFCGRGCHDIGGCTGGCIVPNMYKKLARYEDAEESGLLVRLPCKVGDMVYYIRGNNICGDTVKNIVVDEIGNRIFLDYGRNFEFSDFGVKLFLTYEEAQKAMEAKR